MARGKSISDTDLLDRLVDAIGRIGPADLTFAEAARAAGLSPATLVQRFGARDAMVEATLLRAWDLLDARTQAADDEASPDPAGAIALLLALMPGAAAEHGVTDGLLLLREDFRNPRLRARGAAWGARLAEALGRRLSDNAADSDRLGRQMANVWQGAIIWWAFEQRADPETAIRVALEDWCRTAGLTDRESPPGPDVRLTSSAKT